MIKDIVKILENVCLRHKGVKTFKYQDKILINAQGGNQYYQVVLEDVSYHNLNITNGIFVSEFNLYFLGFPTKNEQDSILDIQDTTYSIACDVMEFIDNMPEYQGVLSVYDYSILTISHFTDDAAAGVRLTLKLRVPSPVDLCTYQDNFNPEPYVPDEDTNIDIPEKVQNENIGLKKIKLPKKKKQTCDC